MSPESSCGFSILVKLVSSPNDFQNHPVGDGFKKMIPNFTVVVVDF